MTPMQTQRTQTVVVFGASGMLGRALCRVLARDGWQVRPMGREDLNLASADERELARVLQGAGAAVNAAGIIKSVLDPKRPEQALEALRVNGAFPINLAKASRKLGIPCVHVTTDCAYDGARGGYDESDLCTADDLYGLSKVAGEAAALDAWVIRTSIIGEEGPGRSRSLLEWARSSRSQTVSGYTNHRWNGLTTVQLAQVIRDWLRQGDRPLRGLAHVHSPQVVTKAELLELISAEYDLGLTIVPTETARGVDRSLRTRVPWSQSLAIPDLRTQIREMRAEFAATSTEDVRES